MTPIRTKDKVFLAVVLPAALALFYFVSMRPGTVKKRLALEARDRVTVTEAAYPGEERAKTRARTDAEAALAREKAFPVPAKDVEGDAAASPARRMQEVMAVFRAAGVRVRSSAAETDAGADDVVSSALRATGLCPHPVVRTYRLEADYRALRTALALFAERKMAVAVSAVTGEGDGKWSVKIHE